MTDNEHPISRTLQNLKDLEAELFHAGHKNKVPKYIPKPDESERDRTAWTPNQQISDLKRERSALKDEVDAVRILLTEQNVITTSSISALKELKEDLDHLAKLLRDSEAELSSLRSEISRVNAEADMEKRHSMQLREILERETALREDMEKLLRDPAQKEEIIQPKTITPGLKEKLSELSRFRRENKPRRFSRGYY
jgi:chromosome segregation ATPase